MTVSTTRTTPWWNKEQIIRYKVSEIIWMQCLKLQSRKTKHRTRYNDELLLYAGLLSVALPGKLKTWHKTDHGKVRRAGFRNVNCNKPSKAERIFGWVDRMTRNQNEVLPNHVITTTMLYSPSCNKHFTSAATYVIPACNSSAISVFIYKVVCINTNGSKYVKPVL